MGERVLLCGPQAETLARFAGGLGAEILDVGDFGPVASEAVRRLGATRQDDVDFESIVGVLRDAVSAMPEAVGWADSAAQECLDIWRAAVPGVRIVIATSDVAPDEERAEDVLVLGTDDIAFDPYGAATRLASHGAVPSLPGSVQGLALSIAAAARVAETASCAAGERRRPPATPDDAWRVAAQLRSLASAGAPGDAAADVSVVICCGDEGRRVVDSVASVVALGPGHPAVIVVNTGSMDLVTMQVCRALDEVGHRVVESDGHGIAAARNAGFGAAQTPFVVPLEPGDLLRPQFLESVAAFDSDVAVVHTDADWFGRRWGRWRAPETVPGRVAAGIDLPACPLIRKDAWAQVGGYADDVAGLEDWDLWLSLLERGWRFVHTDVVGCDRRHRGQPTENGLDVLATAGGAVIGTVHRRHRAFVLDHLDDVSAVLVAEALTARRRVEVAEETAAGWRREADAAHAALADVRGDRDSLLVELYEGRRAVRDVEHLRRHNQELRTAVRRLSAEADAATAHSAQPRQPMTRTVLRRLWKHLR